MAKQQLPRVGYIGLSLELYYRKRSDMMRPLEAFHKTLTGVLGEYADVIDNAFCYTEEAVTNAVDGFVAADVDAVVVTPISYSPSLISVPALARSGLPVVIWNTQKLFEITPEFGGEETLQNHGMHGSQDLANVLNRAGVPYAICSGHFEDPEMLDDLDGWLRAAAAASEARRVTVGQFGPVFVGMGDFGVDETAMRLRWGPGVRRIGLETLTAAMEDLTKKKVDAEIKKDKKRFDFDADVSASDLAYSVRLGMALEQVLKDEKLPAFTMNFQAFGQDGGPETAPFYGINKLLAKGYGYAGEGNVTVAALVRQLATLTGESTFTEMFTTDYANDEIMMCHMGEGNIALAAKGEKPAVRSMPFTFGGEKSRNFLTHIFKMRPGPVTLVNITTDADQQLYLITFEAEVADLPVFENMTMPHFKIAVDAPVRQFLNWYGSAGGTHHLGMVFGRRAHEVEKTARFMDMRVERL